MRDAAERLRDILEAIAAINRYAMRDKKSFEGDELLQGWSLRYLQIIGEAAQSHSAGGPSACARCSLAEDHRHAQRISTRVFRD
jgi:hypothetical protein